MSKSYLHNPLQDVVRPVAWWQQRYF